MADEEYWTYKASTPTPSWIDAIWCGAISSKTTENEWYQLSPGMRREIVRSKEKAKKV
jgi:hypothetical protein